MARELEAPVETINIMHNTMHGQSIRTSVTVGEIEVMTVGERALQTVSRRVPLQHGEANKWLCTQCNVTHELEAD